MRGLCTAFGGGYRLLVVMLRVPCGVRPCPLWRLTNPRCVCATPLAMWLQRRLYDVCSRHVAGSVLNANASNTNKMGGQVPGRRPVAYLIQLSLPF